jgi:hypothetical protein
MLVLEIIILIFLFILVRNSPTYQGINRANQVLDSKLEKLLEREELLASRTQLDLAVEGIRAELANIQQALNVNLDQLMRIKQHLSRLQ